MKPRRGSAAEAQRGRGEREGAERRLQLVGLLLLAGAAVMFSILRAGVHNVFTPGWWRLW